MFEVWDNPRLPCCGICGGLILVDPNPDMFYSNFEGWTAGTPNRVSIDDFRDKIMQEPSSWQSGYRAVVKSETGATFVSGAGYRLSDADIDETGSFPVPKGLGSVLLTREQTWPAAEFIRIKKTQMMLHYPKRVKTGWLFHEVCWIMLEQASDDHVMTNLDLFMIAVYDEMMEKQVDYRRLTAAAGINMLLWQTRLWEATVNPLYSPTLANLVNAALHRQTGEPPQFMPDVRSQDGFPISGGSFYKLHLEIQQMVADSIESEKEFRNLILATRWRFPNIYWKDRIPECFYEVHNGIGDQPVDWQWLGFEVSRIMERLHVRHELRNRIRIHGNIKRLLEYFISRLRKRASLEEADAS